MASVPGERRSYLGLLCDELGILSLLRSSVDVKLLCLQRFVRLFAYGSSTLVLVLYLQALGITKTRIGSFMALTLAGDVCISLVLTLVADRIGRKTILALGAVLMSGSGVVFAVSENYWFLLAAAVFGVISPSGKEIGPFRAIEESSVAHLTSPTTRPDIYAWYSLLGTAGTALGLIICGWSVHYLSADLGWELIDAYRAAFIGYAIFGLLKLLLTLMLSNAVEVDGMSRNIANPSEVDAAVTDTAPLLGDRDQASNHPRARRALLRILPSMSKDTLALITRLCFLFGIDSFASSLASLSWVSYLFRSRYGVEEGSLGTVFFTTSIISAVSMIVAASLARRFGNIKTIVFTQLPSAVFLALIPIPGEVRWSIVFLVLRACTQSMDVAPRSAFMAAVVNPKERTSVMGIINVASTMAQALGPLLTGFLADSGKFWVAFVLAGSLKVLYNIGLLTMFSARERDNRSGQNETTA